MTHLTILQKSEGVETHANSPFCTVHEYAGLPEPFDRCAIAFLCKSYPNAGFVMNKEVDELIHVTSGNATLKFKDGRSFQLRPTDSLFIKKETAFRYEIDENMNLTLFIITHPKFRPEQHVTVE